MILLRRSTWEMVISSGITIILYASILGTESRAVRRREERPASTKLDVSRRPSLSGFTNINGKTEMRCNSDYVNVLLVTNLQTRTVSQSSAWLISGLISAERIFWLYSLYWIFNMLSPRLSLPRSPTAAGSDI